MGAVPELVAGSTDTLLVAAVGNKLIKPVNSLVNMRVNPPSVGKFQYAEGSSVLDLTPIQQIITNSTTITDPTGGGTGDGTTPPATIQQTINNLFSYVAAHLTPTISATCNPDGTITVTLTYPS